MATFQRITEQQARIFAWQAGYGLLEDYALIEYPPTLYRAEYYWEASRWQANNIGSFIRITSDGKVDPRTE